MDIPIKLKELLSNPEIQKAINNNDFDYVYDKLYNSTTLSVMEIFTNILKEINIDPLLYMNKIPAGYFKENKDLRIYKISDNIKTIGEYAFAMCSNLSELYVPKTVNNIEANAFFMCKSLTHIYYEGTKMALNYSIKIPKWVNLFGNVDYTPEILEIFCSDGVIEKVFK